MNKYIDADKLKTEIERLKSVLKDPLCTQGNILGLRWVAGANKMLNEISSFIDSLQQERLEVDFEKEWNEFEDWMKTYNQTDYPTSYTTRDIARHFYELGLNARKE